MKVVVVGAGISGCVCAYRLAEQGHDVVLVEKGRGVGGRMSTRRMAGARIDHGAQFFTAKSDNFKKIIEQGIKNNFIEEFGKFNPPRYRGYKSMRNFLSNLTFNLNAYELPLILLNGSGLYLLNLGISNSKPFAWILFKNKTPYRFLAFNSFVTGSITS